MKTSSQHLVARVVGARRGPRVWIVVLTALVALGAAIAAQAQPIVDPPSRVARLSDASGQVWLFSADTNEWVTIARNRPLTTGDRIATDNGARAEVTLGSTTLRLDAATELEIVRLDDSRFALRLHGGSVAARLRTPQSFAEFELSTDEGRFRAQSAGRFRFDRFDQASEVTAFAGQAIYEARNAALPVTAGQHAQFWIDQAGVPQYALVQVARDDFAAWNDDRDRAEDRLVAQQRRYVSPEMTGAEDLDRYGTWEQTPEYGALWVPRQVPVGWAPYSAGHWAWVRPWGWTWVDDAPWGFAPFHYGRWVYRRDVWCWAPGTYVARPVYAPALVAWIGGPSVSVSLSIGGGGPPVGWVPLAPREVYVPPYRYTQRYVREVNVTHVTNVTNITTIVNNRNGEADRRDFANRKFPNAVTFVPQEVMLRRQPVAPVAAQTRNDPRVRSLVADAAPPPVVTAPPVSAPPQAPRPSAQVRPPRPPFESRGPAVAGRPEARPPAAVEPQRPDPRAGTAPPPRAEVGTPPPRPDGARPDNRGGRPEGRGNERGGPPVVTAPNPAIAPATPNAGAAPATGATPGGPPFGSRGVLVEPSTRPPTRGAPNESAVAPPPRSEAVAPPSPVQRSAPPPEAGGRPAYRNREVADDDRGGPKQAMPPPPRGNAAREAPPSIRESAQPSRDVSPPREGPPRASNRSPEAPVAPPQGSRQAPPSPPPPAVAPQGPPAAQRPPPPAAVAPQAAPPPAAQRPPPEHKMTRPEPPQGREERRDERREGGEKQR